MATSTESVLSQWRAIVICLIAALGAFQFGYDTSYFSGMPTCPSTCFQGSLCVDPGLSNMLLSLSPPSPQAFL